MKFGLFILTATVLAAVANAAVVEDVNRDNLSVGTITVWDRLLYSGYLYRQGIANSIQYQDLVFNGNGTTRISSVQAYEVGYTQYAAAWVVGGGIGFNTVTIRAQSMRGYGFYYAIEIWGR